MEMNKRGKTLMETWVMFCAMLLCTLCPLTLDLKEWRKADSAYGALCPFGIDSHATQRSGNVALSRVSSGMMVCFGVIAFASSSAWHDPFSAHLTLPPQMFFYSFSSASSFPCSHQSFCSFFPSLTLKHCADLPMLVFIGFQLKYRWPQKCSVCG